MKVITVSAKHFISKAVGTDVLAGTIRRVLSGDHSAPEWITPSGAGTPDPADQAPLTPRQLESLSLLHLPNKESACAWGSPKSP